MSRLPDALGEGHMDEPTDAELHVGILAGDQGSIRRWHDRVMPVVRRVLRRKGIPDEDAEEIFDDVFVSTIRHAVTITPLGSGLRPYIMGAAWRKIADHFEAAKTKVERHVASCRARWAALSGSPVARATSASQRSDEPGLNTSRSNTSPAWR